MLSVALTLGRRKGWRSGVSNRNCVLDHKRQSCGGSWHIGVGGQVVDIHYEVRACKRGLPPSVIPGAV